MKSIVADGAGFISSHVAEALVELGHEVVVLDAFVSGGQENLNQAAPWSSAVTSMSRFLILARYGEKH